MRTVHMLSKWQNINLLGFEFKLTARDPDEVLSRCLVHLDVPVADVVLVPPEGHVAVGGALEQDQGLAVATALGGEAQRHAAPAKIKIERLRLELFFDNTQCSSFE